jgi:selenide,water dikinase
VLVQTKPLGTQLAVNANEWQRRGELATRAPSLLAAVGQSSEAAARRVARLQAAAEGCMLRLNRAGARAMRAHRAAAATDITGFGVLGHARNLARSQRARVRLVLERLVVLRDAPLLAADNRYFGLLEGRSAETSGACACACVCVS